MEKDFKNRLKLAMDLRGKKAVDIVENCNIAKGNISRYLNGKLPAPKIQTAKRFADYLDVNVLWLLGIVDNMSAQSREISTISINKAVGLEPTKDELLKQTLLDDITAIASRQDLDTLRTIYNIVKSISK